MGLGLSRHDGLRESGAGVSFAVRVQPRARRTEILGTLGGALKVAVAAPPVEGKANEVLIRFFADLFALPRSAVEIVGGETPRNKAVRVLGITGELVRSRLGV